MKTLPLFIKNRWPALYRVSVDKSVQPGGASDNVGDGSGFAAEYVRDRRGVDGGDPLARLEGRGSTILPDAPEPQRCASGAVYSELQPALQQLGSDSELLRELLVREFPGDPRFLHLCVGVSGSGVVELQLHLPFQLLHQSIEPGVAEY